MHHLKEKIEKNLTDFVHQWNAPADLLEVCSYALLAPAKRYRPLMVHMLAEAVGGPLEVSYAAIAVELFHTASLIADDLPCMDNDSMRRGRPSVHKKYGEALALLASYALIAAGYECLARNGKKHPEHSLRLALEIVSKNTGVQGATGGQYWDLFPPQQCSQKDFDAMVLLKTGSLFEMSFALGWLFGGGEVALLSTVQEASHHFGIIFQIQDDLEDISSDVTNRNYALLFGVEEAYCRVHQEKEKLTECLKKLDIPLSVFLPLLTK